MALLAGRTVGMTATAASARAAKTSSLAAVTFTFGDQLEQYRTVFAATDALKGALYTIKLDQLHWRAVGHRRCASPGSSCSTSSPPTTR